MSVSADTREAVRIMSRELRKLEDAIEDGFNELRRQEADLAQMKARTECCERARDSLLAAIAKLQEAS